MPSDTPRVQLQATSVPPTSMPTSPADDEIDLRQLAAALQRRWRLIAATAGGTLLLSALATLLQKPVWEGEFQIVLASKQDGAAGQLAQLAASNPLLANMAGVGGGGGSQLETEVKILESPSVLKPVFDYVKAEKARAGQNVDKLSFTDWLKSLEVELEKGTSVLTIAYRDTDKALVLPVIRRISQAYQQYSGRDRERGLSQGVAYLQEQVMSLRNQANVSMREAQAFALQNGLGLQDGMPAAAAVSGAGGSSNPTAGSVEAQREAAQNQVNLLRQQLAAARAAGSGAVYQAPQLEANAELYKRLQDLEALLAERSALLKPTDELIQRLKRERASLVSYINQQTAGLIQGQLATAQASLAAYSRPRDVVLRHRELVRQALRDDKTLAELETQLQTLQLEKARATEPWELISTPTLLDWPVSPRPARNLALGLLAGLVLGSGAALVADRRSGLVFATEELHAEIPGPLLAELEGSSDPSLALLAQGRLAGATQVGLIPLGLDPRDPELLAVQQRLQQLLPDTALPLCAEGAGSALCSHQLLITRAGAPDRSSLKRLRQQLRLEERPLTGWLLLPASSSTSTSA